MSGKNGWIYVLENEAIPDLIKIGCCEIDPQDIAEKLSKSDAIPLPYLVKYKALIIDPDKIEKIVYKKLESKKLERDFFKCKVDEAIQLIRELGVVKYEEFWKKEIKSRFEYKIDEHYSEKKKTQERSESLIAHEWAKKNITEITDYLKNIPADEKAYYIFLLWVTGGVNLAEIWEKIKNQKKSSLNIPVYHYQPSAEVPLIALKETYQSRGHHAFSFAVEIHQMSNLAVSFPDEGYFQLILNLWAELNSGYEKKIAGKLIGGLKEEFKNCDKHIKNTRISLDELINNPNSIKPHFLIKGHPLSAELKEIKKIFCELDKDALSMGNPLPEAQIGYDEKSRNDQRKRLAEQKDSLIKKKESEKYQRYLEEARETLRVKDGQVASYENDKTDNQSMNSIHTPAENLDQDLKDIETAKEYERFWKNIPKKNKGSYPYTESKNFVFPNFFTILWVIFVVIIIYILNKEM